MNRDELKEMGLNDDQIEAVMKAYGKATNDLKEKANQVDGLESQIEDYKVQIEDRDQQLETLSKQVKDNEELENTISQMKEDNEATVQEMQEKIEQQAFDHSLENALNSAGVRNTKAVKALLDVESIKLDGDKLLGLDTQLESLKESDEYLFQQGQTSNNPQIVAGGNPDGGGNPTLTKESIMQEQDSIKRQSLIQENMHLFK